MSLKFGVDPATIVITGDGVVRYVVVASNQEGGAINAFYEGVRCSTRRSEDLRPLQRRHLGATWRTRNGSASAIAIRAIPSSWRSRAFAAAMPRGASVGEMVRR